jgi:hypothetical protein
MGRELGGGVSPALAVDRFPLATLVHAPMDVRAMEGAIHAVAVADSGSVPCVAVPLPLGGPPYMTTGRYCLVTVGHTEGALVELCSCVIM